MTPSALTSADPSCGWSEGLVLGPRGTASEAARSATVGENGEPTASDRGLDRRICRGLELIQGLLQQQLIDEEFDVPPLEYKLPDNFLLSVVIPVYNERSTVLPILTRVSAVPVPLELILVDDGSTDGTREILASLPASSGLKCILQPRNRGKGAALRAGFRQALGDIVIVQDADLEYDPRDIPHVIRPIVEGQADVVFGSRFLRNNARGSSRIHRWGNQILTQASNWFTGLSLTDMETCYKAFRREVLLAIPLQQDRFGFEPEITAKLARRGLKVAEVPVRYQARAWEQGKKICWKDAINALYCILRYALAD